MKKILVALSGGVDSSVAASELLKQGYDIECAYMKTWMNEEGIDVFGECPWNEDIIYAEKVCKKLGVKFRVLDFIQQYKEQIVEYLIEGYKNGFTPNPDVMCNRKMKFGVFLDYALKEGFDGVATGHYCQKKINEDLSEDIFEGADKNKDQSYFLSLVKQSQLKKILFPIGDIPKPKVRLIANDLDLANAKRKDSQGICFLGKIRINDFLNCYIPNKQGDIVNLEGKVLGKHNGLHNFTIGQAKGLGVPSNADNEKYVVVSKNFETNQIIVAFDSQKNSGLFVDEVYVNSVHFINEPILGEKEILAKVRYRDASVKIKFIPLQNNKAKVVFSETQRGLAAGQIIALYDGEKLLGGAVYSKMDNV